MPTVLTEASAYLTINYMNKILLVYEDYSEMMVLESSLKKIGFDVIGLSNEYLVGDQIIAFNPDLVLASGKGGKVNTLSVGKKLKEMPRWQGRAVLIFAAGVKPQPQDLLKIRVDMALEAPVPMPRMLQVIARLLERDESLLTERLGRSLGAPDEEGDPLTLSGESDEAVFVRGESREEGAPRSQFRFGDRMSSSDRATQQQSSESLFDEVDLSVLEQEITGTEKNKTRFNLSENIADSDANSSGPNTGDGTQAKKRGSTAQNAQNVPAASPSKAPVALADESKQEASAVEPGVSLEEERAQEFEVEQGDESEQLRQKARQGLEKAQEELQRKSSRYAQIAAETPLSPGKGTVSRVASRKAQKELAASWDPEELQTQDKMRQAFTGAMFKK